MNIDYNIQEHSDSVQSGDLIQQGKDLYLEREDLLEQLYLLDRLVNQKLREKYCESPPKGFCNILRHPVSGTAWRHYLRPGEVSNVLDGYIATPSY